MYELEVKEPKKAKNHAQKHSISAHRDKSKKLEEEHPPLFEYHTRLFSRICARQRQETVVGAHGTKKKPVGSSNDESDMKVQPIEQAKQSIPSIASPSSPGSNEELGCSKCQRTCDDHVLLICDGCMCEPLQE